MLRRTIRKQSCIISQEKSNDRDEAADGPLMGIEIHLNEFGMLPNWVRLEQLRDEHGSITANGEYHMGIRYKVEELQPGKYMVWDRERAESLMETYDLMDACVFCCGLRTMRGEKDVMSPEAMFEYTKWRV